MGERSLIEWTDDTWNPMTGCTRVSPGCALCYIERSIPFRIAGRHFEQIGDESKIPLVFHPERLMRVPRGPRIFVNSLSDLFHEDIPFNWIDDVFEVMRRHDDRVFQVLTKRPERMLEWADSTNARHDDILGGWAGESPLPNVWIGVTIENARYAYRAELLRQMPAAVRFLSCEPLLGSLFSVGRQEDAAASVDEAPLEAVLEPHPEGCAFVTDADVRHAESVNRRAALDLSGIDWVICGGESGGRRARPMAIEWAREIRDAVLRSTTWHASAQAEDGIAPRPGFFFKQWGSHDETGAYCGANPKSGGRLLDGREWNEMPEYAMAVA